VSTISGPPLRRAASEVPTITGLRFLPQEADATLVNISTRGLLAESAARLVVDTPVKVEFIGRFHPAVVSGRVVRCQLAMMGPDGLLRYDIAVEFDAPIGLGEEAAGVPEVPEGMLGSPESLGLPDVATGLPDVATAPRRTVRNRW
jgi:hypothetical protein